MQRAWLSTYLFIALALNVARALASDAGILKSRQESLDEFEEDSMYNKLSKVVGMLIFSVPGVNGTHTVKKCTAIQLSSKSFLTAGHCFEDNFGGDLIYTEVFVELDGPGSADLVELQHDPVKDKDNDFALISAKSSTKFDESILKVGLDPKAKAALFILHHRDGGPLSLTRLDCHAFKEPIKGIFLQHTCDTAGGSSGAPVFNENSELVGMQLKSGLVPDDPNSFNSALLFSELSKNNSIAVMVSKLQKGNGGPKPPNPAAEEIFNVSTGETIVRIGEKWLQRTSKDGKVVTSILIKQQGATSQMTFWDRNNDRIISFPSAGGDILVKNPDDANYSSSAIGTATRVK
jgi:hypothetical protein